MAVTSFDFSSTASRPSTSRLVVAKADTRCSAFWPVLRLWLRREVLPSMATSSGLSGQHHATLAHEETHWTRHAPRLSLLWRGTVTTPTDRWVR
jgi:hypothetical protein